MSFIEVNDLRKTYQIGEIEVRALDGTTFKIEKGEFVVIVGASGAGKTTLLNILGGMDTCDSGSILVDNKEIQGLSPKEITEYRRHDIGFVFQFYNLIPNLTALENVELATEICKDTFPPEEILEEVGLGKRMNNFPPQLSGGEQQRVSIARALAKNAKLLLCDEPTGALDFETGRNILGLLQKMNKEKGVTTIIITHNQAIEAMGNRIIKIKNGKIDSMKINDNPRDARELNW